ncbi:MAG: hypothetical protein J3Q66DRAFT_400394 [Benniella sp.]|nr:MAG: hypothetical protein J3Q66DRAFT_400394 [Benniella sp.]
MHVSSFQLVILWTSLAVLFAPQGIQANTEKVIFTVKYGSEEQSRGSDGLANNSIVKDTKDGTLDPAQWKRLSSPHTIIRAESLLPSFYKTDVTISALGQHAAAAAAVATAQSPLIKEIVAEDTDLQNRDFKWYILEGLEDGASFELRISYPATSPADFDMVVWTLEQAQEQLPKDLSTMLARIKATYTGVSYRSDGISGPETYPVPYNIVLERLYFMIPYQALKLAAVLAVVVVVGFGFLTPRVHRFLVDIASGGSSHIKDSKKTE